MIAELSEVTTRSLRKAVAGWLREEQATIEQALEVESALYAGAIAGGTYRGNRHWADGPINAVSEYQKQTKDEPQDGTDYTGACGCLLDTFERIKGGRRPFGTLPEESNNAFALALNLGMGNTPSNSKWA